MISIVLLLAKVVEHHVIHSRTWDHLLKPKINIVVQFLREEFLVMVLAMKEWIIFKDLVQETCTQGHIGVIRPTCRT